jgi:hypothetical protein
VIAQSHSDAQDHSDERTTHVPVATSTKDLTSAVDPTHVYGCKH